MNTKDYITQLIQEISSKGCTIPADLLQNNLEVLVLYARTEAQQEAIESMFKKTEIIGEHITDAFYKCIKFGVSPESRNCGLTLGKLYQVLPDGSFYDDDGDVRQQMADIYLDMSNPFYLTPSNTTEPTETNIQN